MSAHKHERELERVEQAIDEFQEYIRDTIQMLKFKSSDHMAKHAFKRELSNCEKIQKKLYELNSLLNEGKYTAARKLVRALNASTDQTMYRTRFPNVRNSMILCIRSLLQVVDAIQSVFSGQYYGDKVRTPGAEHKLFDKPITSLKTGVTRLETTLDILKAAVAENKNKKQSGSTP